MAWTKQSAVTDTYKELQGVSDTFKAQNLMSDTWVSLIVTYGGFQADAFQTNAFKWEKWVFQIHGLGNK